ncbi:M20/M25/M40 family metallo-hydrolase [Granulicella sibirica]|uniref:Carboxypeptidase Q n=1 Tax=Granulicella sibirica TaxID=2479048 RepID=A0A4Q0T2L2_9BACT|nr:M20/M25/M40 family metallo-hydrolase [Granulicella sibirica]RXH57905.1 peptidase M28 [Granulicella sibirica]
MKFSSVALALCLLATQVYAADKPKPAPIQPAAEALDLDTIARIRDEGLVHSHIMEYASGLFDGIGPRLTGSPDFAKAADWSVDQLRRMGAANPHTESWGEFGIGWQQTGTVLQMTAPGTATFLAQAAPWSPATAGEITAQVVAIPTLKEEKDFDKWKGKLAGKIILYGDAPKINPDPSAPLEHYDTAKLAHLRDYPLDGNQNETDVLPYDQEFWGKVFKDMAFLEKTGHFFADEHALAVLRPGGSGGVLHGDTTATLGWFVFQPQHKQAIPSASIANEAFGRMSRLLSHDVPVSVRLNIATRITGEHEQGMNVIGEIPGTDPMLKDQVVMLGGHLDSWIPGTGATDDGAGVIVALEAMRILRALDIHTRRTIRVALWGGEEQGIFGSSGYVASHFANLSYSQKPEDQIVPTFVRAPTAMSAKPEHAKLDAYYNTDNGTGKFLGIYAEGNSAAASIFEQWAAPIRDLGFSTVSLRNTGSTDHVSFQLVGLPGFQFIQDPRDYETRTHHTNLDTYERLSEPDLRQMATVMAIFVYNTSQRDAMMPRMPLPRPELDPQRAKPLEGLFPKP